MEDMIEKLPKEWQENATLRLIKNEEERIHNECEAFLGAFKKNYDSLSEETKKSIAEHAPMIETEEQANAAAKMIGMFAALGL